MTGKNSRVYVLSMLVSRFESAIVILNNDGTSFNFVLANTLGIMFTILLSFYLLIFPFRK